MNGSVLRQRLHTLNKSGPVEVATSDTEYFSNSADQTPKSPIQTTTHEDRISSQDMSEADSSEESDDVGVPFDSQAGTSASAPTSPLVDSSLPPPDEQLNDAVIDRAWYEFDLSVVLALVSPLANWLTGSDHVKNVLLILLLVFYLHQIIEVPWTLYLASRPRRATRKAPQNDNSSADKYHQAALSELRSLEIFYLVLSALSPFLGALLLRTVVATISGPPTMSWFSTSLFVLATGMRPWKHTVHRLRKRATDLHTVIHYPPSAQLRMEALIENVAQLQLELKILKEESKHITTEVHEQVEDAIGVMEKAARRQEKKTEVTKSSFENRLTKLEQNVDVLLERIEIRADRSVLDGTIARVLAYFSALTDYLLPFLPLWLLARSHSNIPPSPRSPKPGRSHPPTKLETIPEVATFQPKTRIYQYPHIRIPGLGLALRIGDLATLPTRRVVGYLLAGRLYNPSRTPSSS